MSYDLSATLAEIERVIALSNVRADMAWARAYRAQGAWRSAINDRRWDAAKAHTARYNAEIAKTRAERDLRLFLWDAVILVNRAARG